VVLTTKHHDGFCLWDSALTDYSTAHTIGRDLVREYVDALREVGLRVGLYHSLLDWHHPDYTLDRWHPLRQRPDAAALFAGRDWGRYLDYLYGQVTELLTNYGPIDYLFFDFTNPAPDPATGLPGRGPADWHSEDLLALCRRLQPHMVVNDRLGIPGDLITPELHQPSQAPIGADGAPLLWESCVTIGGTWAYNRDDDNFKPPDQLIRALVGAVSMNGNLLLNIGPDGRGAIRAEEADRFRAIGRWLDVHREAVVGAGPAGLTPAPGATYTRRGDRLYVALEPWPLGRIELPGLAGHIRFARLLHDGTELQVLQSADQFAAATLNGRAPDAGTATLLLPARRPAVALPVAELMLDESTLGDLTAGDHVADTR
jgi:alpha-L-fucosidase